MKPYEGQQFAALRKQCKQKRTLFEDPLYPAVDQSLFYQGNRIGKITWKRPKVREAWWQTGLIGEFGAAYKRCSRFQTCRSLLSLYGPYRTNQAVF